MTEHTPLSRPGGTIIAVHLNYRSRAAQRGRTPTVPSYFFKPSSSVAASGSTLERPAGCELLAFEGEIALVMGARVRRVAPEEGWAAVAGITAANDFGVYDLRVVDKGSNVRSKGGDGFTPLGPHLIPARVLGDHVARVRTWLNGTLVQEGTTDDLLFPFGQLIADLSQLITLNEGDVILTGTPAGSSVTVPGDTVEVEVDVPKAPGAPSSGRLVTHISEGSIPFAEFGAQPQVDDRQRAEAWGTPPPVASEPFSLTAELRAQLASVATATLSSQLRRRGLNSVSIEGLTSTRPDHKLVGRAKTLRYIPLREDLFAAHGGGFNAQKQAFDTVTDGDVIVIEARGETGSGTVGDILALRAQVRGAAGIVTDGGVRDLTAVAEMTIPTYHAGAHPAVLGRKHVPWECDVTVSCGGASIQPGDVIVGDADGLVVIPPGLVREVAADALAQEEEETFISEMVAAGERIEGLFPLNDTWKERYAQWRKEQ